MVRITFIFFFSMLAITAGAQNIESDTVEWTAKGVVDEKAATKSVHSCKFVTYGLNQIKWVQQNGQVVILWDVLKTSGSLNSLEDTGNRKYFFQDKTMKGELTLVKNPDQSFIELTLKGGTSDFQLKYMISSIQKL